MQDGLLLMQKITMLIALQVVGLLLHMIITDGQQVQKKVDTVMYIGIKVTLKLVIIQGLGMY